MTVPAQESESTSQTLVIVGVGLIGGSIAAAVKQRLPKWQIVGVGRSLEKLTRAKELGLVDSISDNLSQAVENADLIVFCTPVDQIASQVIEAAASCQQGTLLTDAGSVKESICNEIAAAGLPNEVLFVGSHPLAGSEKKGFEHADPQLFQGKLCVITPNKNTPEDATNRLSAFWESLGMRVTHLDSATHDAILARTSHLPHLVAAGLASQLTNTDYKFAATGFADTTRIAAGDPDLWVAIMLANADALSKGLDNFVNDLSRFGQALANRDAGEIRLLLQRAQAARKALDEHRA